VLEEALEHLVTGIVDHKENAACKVLRVRL
jgi:hypothetical protein